MRHRKQENRLPNLPPKLMPGPPQAELAAEGTAQSLYPSNAGAEYFLQPRTRLCLISRRSGHLESAQIFRVDGALSTADSLQCVGIVWFATRPIIVHGARTNCGLPPQSVQTLNKDSSIESPCPIDRPGACTLPRRCGCSASRSRRFFCGPPDLTLRVFSDPRVSATGLFPFRLHTRISSTSSTAIQAEVVSLVRIMTPPRSMSRLESLKVS